MEAGRETGDELLEPIRELCTFEGRLAGTDAERRAANRFAERLRSMGRDVEVEPTYVHPQAPAIHAVHCLIGIAGSLIAVAAPAVGFALVLIAATSLYLDLNGRLYLLRNLFFRRASQNVVSPGAKPDAPARLLVVANLDAGRSGAIFDSRNVRRLTWIARHLRIPPTRIPFWSLAALLPVLGLRMAGVEADAASVLQLPPTVALLVATFLLFDIQLSNVTPGANDNGSGVTVALALAEQLDKTPPDNLDAWIVLTGGTDGMRSFVRSRRRELDASTTFVLALDSLGAGQLRYVASEGLTVPFEMDGRLLELCEAIALADRESGHRYDAAPVRSALVSNALPARVAKWRATAIRSLEPDAIFPPRARTQSDLPEHIEPRALARARDFALELIKVLDQDIARAREHGTG